ncbi:MAG: hypothetical protein ACOCVF_02105 [bacterium]
MSQNRPVDYDRYEIYRNDDDSVDQIPFITIPTSPADKFERWVEGSSRLDKFAQRYYNNPFFDWIILYGNPEYLSEFDIPDGTVIRIPFPLDRAREFYESALQRRRNQTSISINGSS